MCKVNLEFQFFSSKYISTNKLVDKKLMMGITIYHIMHESNMISGSKDKNNKKYKYVYEYVYIYIHHFETMKKGNWLNKNMNVRQRRVMLSL